MSKLSFYLTVVALCVCGCALLAAAAPRHERHKKHAVHVKKRNSESSWEQLTAELPEVLNKTVCPIEQVVDDDPLRVPRRIKMLKCAPAPSAVCRDKDVAAEHACCGSVHQRFNTQCVEVHDRVVVSYPADGKRHLRSIVVSVGCTCMIRPTQQGKEDAPS